jgi:hypothetical protein
MTVCAELGWRPARTPPRQSVTRGLAITRSTAHAIREYADTEKPENLRCSVLYHLYGQ